MRISAFFLLGLLTQAAWSQNPAWVNNPQRECPDNFLCSVGEAAGRSQAKAQARAGIAKIFQTEIKSKFTEVVFANDNLSEQSMSATTEEMTDMTLEGVEILKFHEDKLGYYALAGLNKRKLAANYRTKLDEIDQELSSLWQGGQVGDLMKMGPLMAKRSLYYDRIAFLTGLKVPLPISFKAYLSKKKGLFNKVTIKIGDELDMPKELREVIAKELSQLGFNLNTGGSSSGPSTHFLKGKLETKKEYLNVEGFERHRFNLILKAFDKNQKETGFLKFETVDTGRNFEQTFEKAMNSISEYLNKNIHVLNIE